MLIITLISVLISSVTLFFILKHNSERKIERVIDSYISLLDSRSELDYRGNEIGFLIKAGARNLTNKQIKEVNNRLVERKMESPFHSIKDFEEIKKEKFKRILLNYQRK